MSPQEIETAVAEIRERVRERYRKTVPGIEDFELPSLDLLGHARDAAEGKAAAIGRVNPRPGGLVNTAIQFVKRFIARCLNWFVRDQIDYNRAVITYMERVIETMAEQNHNCVRIARELVDAQQNIADVRNHWNNWRPEWEERLTAGEIKFLRMVHDVEGGAREREEAIQASGAKMHREYSALLAQSIDELQQRFWAEMAEQAQQMVRDVESGAREHAEAVEASGAKMHREYSALLAQSIDELQRRFWADMEKQRTEQEKLIHTELRLIRRRSRTPAAAPAAAPAVDETAPATGLGLDYGRFEERFRGSEQYVAENQSRYLDIFRGLTPVADIGCGRGELLALFQAEGVACFGVDSDPDSVSACLEKGLNVEAGDLFAFLRRRENGSLGAVVSTHVVEHLPPLQLPELVELAVAKLKTGGILAIETPNPACLAIFAGDFYLDPTHQRPVPAQQLRFYMEESGLDEIDVRELNPAHERIPELTSLREDPSAGPFVKKFFGGRDYVILGRKL